MYRTVLKVLSITNSILYDDMGDGPDIGSFLDQAVQAQAAADAKIREQNRPPDRPPTEEPKEGDKPVPPVPEPPAVKPPVVEPPKVKPPVVSEPSAPAAPETESPPSEPETEEPPPANEPETEEPADVNKPETTEPEAKEPNTEEPAAEPPAPPPKGPVRTSVPAGPGYNPEARVDIDTLLDTAQRDPSAYDTLIDEFIAGRVTAREIWDALSRRRGSINPAVLARLLSQITSMASTRQQGKSRRTSARINPQASVDFDELLSVATGDEAAKTVLNDLKSSGKTTAGDAWKAIHAPGVKISKRVLEKLQKVIRRQSTRFTIGVGSRGSGSARSDSEVDIDELLNIARKDPTARKIISQARIQGATTVQQILAALNAARTRINQSVFNQLTAAINRAGNVLAGQVHSGSAVNIGALVRIAQSDPAARAVFARLMGRGRVTVADVLAAINAPGVDISPAVYGQIIAAINRGSVSLGVNVNLGARVDISALIRLAQGDPEAVRVLTECQRDGRTTVGEILEALTGLGIHISDSVLGRLTSALTRFGLRVKVGLGINTRKLSQQAVESVKKILKLAQGILVSVLKQLADFLKTYLPQIASTTVTFCNALLPPYVDALVGCTAPILQLIGLLIAECPKPPEVENSTSAEPLGPGPKGPQPLGPEPSGRQSGSPFGGSAQSTIISATNPNPEEDIVISGPNPDPE